MKTLPEKPLEYVVTLTDSGKWLNAPGSDFLFAYIDSSWPPELAQNVGKAFEAALKMPTVIKEAVLKTSGQAVENGLYLLNQSAMTSAMNSIQGMGMTSVDQQHQSGDGTAVEINKELFTAILGGLGGDVTPLLTYLTSQMQNIQAQTKRSKVTEDFGTVIGLVSVMPVLNVVETNFQFVYSSEETSHWFVSVNCGGSAEHYSYDYQYTVVKYAYTPGS
jgi:hypothetical protein